MDLILSWTSSNDFLFHSLSAILVFLILERKDMNLDHAPVITDLVHGYVIHIDSKRNGLGSEGWDDWS